jgi:cytochrome P450
LYAIPNLPCQDISGYHITEEDANDSTATGFPREATSDLTIDGVWIPKGTTVDIVGSVSHLSPLIWGEDVDRFDPSRWDRLTSIQSRPYVFEAFSHGPRICIGRQFAMLESKAVIIELISRFRFLKLEQPFTVVVPSFVLSPQDMMVRVGRVE